MSIDEQAATYREWVRMSREIEALRAELKDMTDDRDRWKNSADFRADEIRRLRGEEVTT